MNRLVSNISLWEEDTFLKEKDFLIVGAGFTGKYIALELAIRYPKATIAIVDRSPFSAGASTRNAGFATFGNVSEIVDDLKNMTYEDVLGLIKDRFDGLNWILRHFPAKYFDYKQTGGYEFFEHKNSVLNAQNNLNKINSLMCEATGIKSVFINKEIPDKRFIFESYALYNEFEGLLHPGKLNLLIDEKLRKYKVQFLNGLEVNQITNNILHTVEGYTIKAKQIFIATNAFAPQITTLTTEVVKPARGQIFVTNELKKPIPQGIYHCDDGYIYFRSLGNRILIGGGRNKFFKKEENYKIETNDFVIQYLTSFLKERVITNETFHITNKWSGIMAMGNGKNPIITELTNNQIICVRMGGIGVALSPIAAQKAVKIFEGKDN
jgi:gamma-glutamylputrescine oxidase